MGLASRSISRRQAFKWLGGAIFGGMLASIPGVAWSAGSGACARFSLDLPPGPLRAQCERGAAQGTGLCYQCGPGGTNEGLCGTTCCGPEESCQDGVCVQSRCPEGTVSCSGSGVGRPLCCGPEELCTHLEGA